MNARVEFSHREDVCGLHPTKKTKQMKRLSWLITVAIFAFSASQAVAQQRGDRSMKPEDRAKQMTERMKADVQLTDAQYEKVYALNLKQVQEMQEARKNAATQQSDRREAFRTMQKSREDELSKILSAEQMKQYREAQQKNAEKARERRGSGKRSK